MQDMLHIHIEEIQARIAQLVAYGLGTGRSWVQNPEKGKNFSMKI